MPTLDEMHKRIFGDVKPEETNLRCPISGDILMALPVERGVMDPMYPYLVTEENLQETIEKWTLPIHNWGKENLINFEKFGTIQTGDTIDELVTGGALSIRHYEHVVRNGEIIYKRLIAMS